MLQQENAKTAVLQKFKKPVRNRSLATPGQQLSSELEVNSSKGAHIARFVFAVVRPVGH
jgi:hypothetical protein